MMPIQWGFMGPPHNRKETPVSEDEVLPEDWSDPLTGHRIDRFSELGFGLFESLELAVKRVDWHDAQALLKKGASHTEALEILR